MSKAADSALDAHNEAQFDNWAKSGVSLARQAVKEKPYGRLVMVIEWRDGVCTGGSFEAKETFICPALTAGK